jgi:hypothetical protein
MRKWIITIKQATQVAFFAVVIFFVALAPCSANTTKDMLDLIGGLEAPEGYDQYYGGIKHAPPKPLSRMRVSEVLDWQREAARTSVSTAAGRYQFIRPTLQGLVDAGVVSPNARFNGRTQDKLGAHLLRQAGYRDGVTDPKIANRIAGVWAALPIVDGDGAGLSRYHGIAGNRALITPEAYLGVMDGSISVEAALRMGAAIRKALDVGHFIDQILEKLDELIDAIIEGIGEYALIIAMSLFGIQFVWHVARSFIEEEMGAFLFGMTYRLAFLTILTFMIVNSADLVKMLNFFIGKFANAASLGEDLVISDYFRQKSLQINSLEESTIPYGTGSISGSVLFLIFLIRIVNAILFAVIVWHYASALIPVAMSFFVIGFGVLDSLRNTTFMALSSFVEAILRITIVQILLFMLLEQFTMPSPAAIDIAQMATTYFALDLFFLLLIVFMPMQVAGLSKVKWEPSR